MAEAVEVLRDEDDKEQFDASVILNRKPGKYYRWARNEDMNLIKRRLDGYEICTDPDIKSVLNASTRVKKGTDTDGTIVFGDMILMETSMENHEKLMERERKKIVRRTQGVMTSYRSKIGRSPDGRDLGFEEHGVRADKEGKGYADSGYTEERMQRELEASPMHEEQRSWRRRSE